MINSITCRFFDIDCSTLILDLSCILYYFALIVVIDENVGRVSVLLLNELFKFVGEKLLYFVIVLLHSQY